MSDKCPEKIWIMPEYAMEFNTRPRYGNTADYVRGDVHKGVLDKLDTLLNRIESDSSLRYLTENL